MIIALLAIAAVLTGLLIWFMVWAYRINKELSAIQDDVMRGQYYHHTKNDRFS